MAARARGGSHRCRSSSRASNPDGRCPKARRPSVSCRMRTCLPFSPAPALSSCLPSRKASDCRFSRRRRPARPSRARTSPLSARPRATRRCSSIRTTSHSMVAGLEKILRDEELRKGLRKRGRERAAQFTWARAAERTAENLRPRSLTHSKKKHPFPSRSMTRRAREQGSHREGRPRPRLADGHARRREGAAGAGPDVSGRARFSRSSISPARRPPRSRPRKSGRRSSRSSSRPARTTGSCSLSSSSPRRPGTCRGSTS